MKRVNNIVKIKPEGQPIKVFLDTCALFKGIWSPIGGECMVLKLAVDLGLCGTDEFNVAIASFL